MVEFWSQFTFQATITDFTNISVLLYPLENDNIYLSPCSNEMIQFIQDDILDCATYIFTELQIPAIYT